MTEARAKERRQERSESAMSDVVKRLGEVGVVPLAVFDTPGEALPIAEALVGGGIAVVEVALRTHSAIACIEEIASKMPQVLVAAGSVYRLEDARRAQEAGARFVVSPGLSRDVTAWCLDQGVPIVPGVATATEIVMALDMGVHTMKFFPAEALGGSETLTAVSAPFPEVRFVPTGGIQAGNLGGYLSLPMVLACAGSWLLPGRGLSEERLRLITTMAREACSIVARTRRPKAYLDPATIL